MMNEMLSVDCVKNGEKFCVLIKTRKTVVKLFFRKTFYVWQITLIFFLTHGSVHRNSMLIPIRLRWKKVAVPIL